MLLELIRWFFSRSSDNTTILIICIAGYLNQRDKLQMAEYLKSLHENVDRGIN